MESPKETSPQRIAVVMAVFNRRSSTLRCLESLHHQTGIDSVSVDVFVVDDASTDGTAEAVAEQFPAVRLIPGTGQLYWNNGMRLGLEEAYRSRYDYYCWLNDDVELDSDAVHRMLAAAEAMQGVDGWPGILVGSVRDPEDGHLTYGGVQRSSTLRRFAYSFVEPADEPVPAETMNGNYVLIPDEVVTEVGNLSPEFQQKMGDYDYGLRAREAGYGVWVAPGTFGTCARNPTRRTDTAPLVDEVRQLWSTKELPFRPWATFSRRWGGRLWPIYFASPYVQRTGRLIVERLRR